ncbi:MAG: YraN family protein, partial [Bacteroidota bacterium]
MDRKSKGILAEQLAQDHYKNHGYEILEANYRHHRAEVDFIALNEQESLLVFVEVKKRSRSDFGDPETFVSENQVGLIKEAAEAYILGINWNKDIRFDIVAVDS